MHISFNVPDDARETLSRALGNDIDCAAREAMAVELYRQDKLTHFELSQVLGLTRFETEEILKKHNVIEDLIPMDEFLQEVDSPSGMNSGE